jgi:hypothetical protein
MAGNDFWAERVEAEQNFRSAHYLIGSIFAHLDASFQGDAEIQERVVSALGALRTLLEQNGYDVAVDPGNADPPQYAAGVAADAMFMGVLNALAAAPAAAAPAQAQPIPIQQYPNPPQQPNFAAPQVPAMPGGLAVPGLGGAFFLDLYDDNIIKIQNVGNTRPKLSVWVWDQLHNVWTASYGTPYRMKLTETQVTGNSFVLMLTNLETNAVCTEWMSVETINRITKLAAVRSNQEFLIHIKRPQGEKGRIPHQLSVLRQNDGVAVGSVQFLLSSKTTVLNTKKTSAPPSPRNAGSGNTY